MLGGVERTIIGGFSAVVFGFGLTLCLTGSIPIIVFGAALAFAALLIGFSLITGHIFPRLGPSSSGSMEGVPLVAPLSYQVDQVRQAIPDYHGIDIDTYIFWQTFQKTTRKRKNSLYEPLSGASLGAALEYLVSTGELVRIGNAYRVVNLPKLWVRWRHGKDAKT